MKLYAITLKCFVAGTLRGCVFEHPQFGDGKSNRKGKDGGCEKRKQVVHAERYENVHTQHVDHKARGDRSVEAHHVREAQSRAHFEGPVTIEYQARYGADNEGKKLGDDEVMSEGCCRASKKDIGNDIEGGIDDADHHIFDSLLVCRGPPLDIYELDDQSFAPSQRCGVDGFRTKLSVRKRR